MMKLNIVLKCLLICCLVYAASACSQKQVRLQTIYSSNNCALVEQTIRTFHTSSELDQFIRSLPRNFSQSPVSPPEVDFEKQSLLLYATGQKPTSGYSIELYHEAAIIKQQVIYLPVRVRKPEAGSVQAQVITSPCQIYSFPKADYSEIVIQDR
jgi:hypothetical protein